jgi:hypothetical protein
MMRDGLAAGDRVQLHINNGKKKAYTRNGLDWIKRFSVDRSAAFCLGRVKSASDVVDGARSRHRSVIGWFVEDESPEGSRPHANYHDRFGYRQERVPGSRH